MEKRKPLSRLFDYAGRYKVLTILSMIFSAISAGLAILPFVFIWRIIQEVIDVMPDFSQATDIAFNGWMAVASSIGAIAVYVAALMCSHFAAFRIASNIRKKTIKHVTELPVGSLSSIGSGNVRRIINESSAATETYLAHQLPDMARAFVTPIAILIMLFVFDWRMGLASLIPVFVVFVVMIVMLGKRMEKRMKQYQNALGDMNNEAVEYVRGIAVVKTFGQTVFSFKRFSDSIERYRKFVVDYTISLRKPMMAFQVLTSSIFAFVIAAAFLIMSSGGITTKLVTDLIFYVIFTPMITLMLNKIMYSSENNMIVKDAMNRVDSLMEISPLTETALGKLPESFDINFSGVTFSYKDSDTTAIDNMSFSIPAGSRTALVGPSGGGKSTAAGLISRFWDPDSGNIFIGGVNVKDIKKNDLMNIVSFVFQDSKLIKGSVLENVRMAKPDASREEVLKALKDAQCDDIIAKLPNGIDTVYGSKGVYLSGGECQRITIARAMLKNSPVIILDEATAFADPENEYKVHMAFEKLSEDKTVIIIAHRLSTVSDADKIFVLSEGRISEEGNHEELMKTGGIYSKMWKDYQKSITWKVKREKEND